MFSLHRLLMGTSRPHPDARPSHFLPRTSPLSPQYVRLSIEREGTCARDPHVHELAPVTVGAFKNHDLVAARAAHHSLRIFFAGSFRQNLHLPPDETRV